MNINSVFSTMNTKDILNHLAAIVCNLLCLKLTNWMAGQLFVLPSVSSLCVCAIRCHQCIFHIVPAGEHKAFFILFLHQWWKNSMFYKMFPCISDKTLQHRKRFASELQRNHSGVRNSMCKSDTGLIHLASQGRGSLPFHLLRPWKGCRRAAFCCRDATASTEQRTVYLLMSLSAYAVVVSSIRRVLVATEKGNEGGSSFGQNIHVA